MKAYDNIPDLEPRFLEPEGWRWHSFVRAGKRLRFGSVFPKDSIPDAVVVCLPGLSEYGEKYFEVARDILNMNMAFWVLDWSGQGGSDRYLEKSDKRHSYGLQNDIDDLHYFIMEYIKHSSVHPDKGRIPMVMLGHSMGGNIGLHYLRQFPKTFECAAFSAPMWGINAVKAYPPPLALALTGLMRALAGTHFAPGETTWQEAMRTQPSAQNFSHDDARSKVHNAWMAANEGLRIGGVTWGWLAQAVRSCYRIAQDNFAPAIQTPVLIAAAGKDFLVNNKVIEAVARELPQAKLIELERAGHEILMETDEMRGVFLREFYQLVEDNIIRKPETLKPF